MIERVYRCNLCDEECDEERLLALRATGGLDGTLRRDFVHASNGDRHICKECIKAIRELKA